jgi:hypothetical protein
MPTKIWLLIDSLPNIDMPMFITETRKSVEMF